jgi:membrane protein implicated in regulation of membrane protease activity
MDTWHIWIIVGVAFLILEVFTPGFFVASLGVGAFLASVASYFDLSPTWQIVAMTVGTLLTFLFVRPLILATHKRKADPRETGTNALIGRDALVLETIVNSTNRGRVKIGGEEWKARSSTGEDIAEDVTVKVDKIEGATAFVIEKKEN